MTPVGPLNAEKFTEIILLHVSKLALAHNCLPEEGHIKKNERFFSSSHLDVKHNGLYDNLVLVALAHSSADQLQLKYLARLSKC